MSSELVQELEVTKDMTLRSIQALEDAREVLEVHQRVLRKQVERLDREIRKENAIMPPRRMPLLLV